jgi:Ca-activated chloride channel homolog
VLLFEYPWLFALAPLPLLIWALLPPHRDEQESVRVPFFEETAAAAGLKPSRGAVILKTGLLQKIVAPLIWILLVAAMARPQWVEDPVEKIESARDLMLAIDLSQSMEARDFTDRDGNRVDRLTAVKEVVNDFIEKRTGDRIGLIVFGAGAYPQVPFTLDHESCRILLDQAGIGMAGPQTAIGDAIGLAIKQFENSKVEERVLIVLTDGNDTASKMPPDKAAEIAEQNGIVIHTIGIGDPAASGENQVDLEALRHISETTGGRSFRGEDREELAGIYATLDEMTPQNFNRQTWRPKRPLYFWPLGGAAGLLLLFYLIMIVWTLIGRRSSGGGAQTTEAAG